MCVWPGPKCTLNLDCLRSCFENESSARVHRYLPTLIQLMSSVTPDNRPAGPSKLVRYARDVLQDLSSRIPVAPRSTHSLAQCRTESTHSSPVSTQFFYDKYCQHVSAEVLPTFPEFHGHQSNSFFYEQAPHVVQVAKTCFSAPAALIDPSLLCVAHSHPMAAYLMWHARQEILEWQHAPARLGPWVGRLLLLASLLPLPLLTENTLRCHVALPTETIQPISVLLRAMLRAGAREAFSPTPLTEPIHQYQTEGKECPILFQLFQWFATQLAPFIELAVCAQAALSLIRHVFVNPTPFLKPAETTESDDVDLWQKEVETALQKLESARARLRVSADPAKDR